MTSLHPPPRAPGASAERHRQAQALQHQRQVQAWVEGILHERFPGAFGESLPVTTLLQSNFCAFAAGRPARTALAL